MNQDTIVSFVSGTLIPAAALMLRKWQRQQSRSRRGEAQVVVAELAAEQDDKRLLWERVQKLEGRVEALEHERGTLLVELSEKRIEIERLKQQIREKDQDIGVLEATIREHEITIRRLQPVRAQSA